MSTSLLARHWRFDFSFYFFQRKPKECFHSSDILHGFNFSKEIQINFVQDSSAINFISKTVIPDIESNIDVYGKKVKLYELACFMLTIYVMFRLSYLSIDQSIVISSLKDSALALCPINFQFSKWHSKFIKS